MWLCRAPCEEMIILLIITINSEGTSKSSQTLLFRRQFFKVVCLGSISSVSECYFQKSIAKFLAKEDYDYCICILKMYFSLSANWCKIMKMMNEKEIILLNYYTSCSWLFLLDIYKCQGKKYKKMVRDAIVLSAITINFYRNWLFLLT